MSHSIDVRLQRHEAYAVNLGMNLKDELLSFFSVHYSNQQLFILIDAKVNRLHGERVNTWCRQYFKNVHLLEIPEGESSKSVTQWNDLLGKMLQKKVERATPLLAVGGGVTGDVAGFAAASVLRGIPLIHMPTSLLAMVDSSMGGKTGVNHPAGKNLIGAFYQPDAVFINAQFLKTLEQREWAGGMAEMLKYAAIEKPAMFEELHQAVAAGFIPSAQWLDLIHQSATIKCAIVERDEREAGERAVLNFGHTFGHALEKLSGFGNISHGEAVFTGMIAAVHYSHQQGAPVEKIRFEPFISLYDINLPTSDRIPELIEAMRYDKKVRNASIRLVALDQWGAPRLETCRDESQLADAWQAAFEAIKK